MGLRPQVILGDEAEQRHGALPARGAVVLFIRGSCRARPEEERGNERIMNWAGVAMGDLRLS